jgi:hypothetical protein
VKRFVSDDCQERPGGWFTQETMASRGAWISLVDRPVAQAVEEHRGRAGEDHAGENEEQRPHCRMTISGH